MVQVPEYMLCLQNGRFDHPDRMFNSIPQEIYIYNTKRLSILWCLKYVFFQFYFNSFTIQLMNLFKLLKL